MEESRYERMQRQIALLANAPVPVVPFQAELTHALGDLWLSGESGMRDPDRALAAVLVYAAEPASMLAPQFAEILHGEQPAVFVIEQQIGDEEDPSFALLGPVPGFSGGPGRLSEFLLERPDGIVFFDDALALSDPVLSLVAVAAENGQFRDNEGRTIDTRQATFVVTARVGHEVVDALHVELEAKPGDFGNAWLDACWVAHPDHLSPWTFRRFDRQVFAHLLRAHDAGGLQALRAMLPERAAIPDLVRGYAKVTLDAPGVSPLRKAGIEDDGEAEYDVFVSYRTALHAPIAERVVSELAEAGFDVWFDQRKLAIKENTEFDRAELADALVSAVSRSRCSVIFELALKVAHLPESISWKQAIDRKLIMETDSGTVVFNWQKLENDASDKLLAIDHGGRRVYEAEGKPAVSRGARSFADDDELVEIVLDYVAEASATPREPYRLHQELSRNHFEKLLVADFDEAAAKIRDVFEYGSEHPLAEAVLRALGEFDGALEQKVIVGELLASVEVSLGRTSGYHSALEGQLHRTPRDGPASERILELTRRRLADGPLQHAPLRVFALTADDPAADELLELIITGAVDVARINQLVRGLGVDHGERFERHVAVLWAAGQRLDAREFEDFLAKLCAIFGDDPDSALHPRAWAQRRASLDPPPRYAFADWLALLGG